MQHECCPAFAKDNLYRDRYMLEILNAGGTK